MFWRECTTSEFWAGIDWITEKNLDAEERIDEARGQRRNESKGVQIKHKGGVSTLPEPGSVVTYNPDMNIVPNPDYIAWRKQVERELGAA